MCHTYDNKNNNSNNPDEATVLLQFYSNASLAQRERWEHMQSEQRASGKTGKGRKYKGTLMMMTHRNIHPPFASKRRLLLIVIRSSAALTIMPILWVGYGARMYDLLDSLVLRTGTHPPEYFQMDFFRCVFSNDFYAQHIVSPFQNYSNNFLNGIIKLLGSISNFSVFIRRCFNFLIEMVYYKDVILRIGLVDKIAIQLRFFPTRKL